MCHGIHDECVHVVFKEDGDSKMKCTSLLPKVLIQVILEPSCCGVATWWSQSLDPSNTRSLDDNLIWCFHKSWALGFMYTIFNPQPIHPGHNLWNASRRCTKSSPSSCPKRLRLWFFSRILIKRLNKRRCIEGAQRRPINFSHKYFRYSR